MDRDHTVKKVSNFPVTSRDVFNQTLPGWGIRARDGKIANLVLQCMCTVQCEKNPNFLIRIYFCNCALFGSVPDIYKN
jgi:hypothetical protein